MQEIEAAAMDPLEISPDKNHGINENRIQGDVAAKELHTLVKKMLVDVPGKPFEERPVTIFRLPAWFHEKCKHLCEPKVVAIGPIHHSEKSLFLAIEEHKRYTLRDFVARSENIGLEVYCQAMQSIEAHARQCYSEAVNMESDVFAMMLLLDGCFILEWFVKHSTGEKDSICDIGWGSYAIFFDMLLSENQVPFFVIHKLWTIHTGWSQDCNNHCPLLELILEILEEYCIFQFRRPQISCKDIHHLLHLFYSGVVSDANLHLLEMNTNSHNNFRGLGCSPFFKLISKSRKAHTQSSDGINIPCVTDLHDAGVKFKRKMEPRNMFDISFEDGTIHLPFLQIDAISGGILWNMVVFEQNFISRNLPQTLSSYYGLMDSLINTENDVAILERAGIIESYFQNAQQTANFFNQFTDNFVLHYHDHYFQDLFKNVKRYSESTWHTYRARLMHDYFSNPWSIISVVAATILLVLTFIQTYYSVAK